MNAEHLDYPLYRWDLQWWKYLDVLGGAKRKEVPDAAAVYDRLVQYAFAGDIAWEYVLQADSLDKAKRGLASLFDRMADELTTSDQLRGLLTSMNGAAEQKGATVKFREATGTRRPDLRKPRAGKTRGTAVAEGLARGPHVCGRHLVTGRGRLLGAKNPRGGQTRIGNWPGPLRRSAGRYMIAKGRKARAPSRPATLLGGEGRVALKLARGGPLDQVGVLDPCDS